MAIKCRPVRTGKQGSKPIRVRTHWRFLKPSPEVSGLPERCLGPSLGIFKAVGYFARPMPQASFARRVLPALFNCQAM